MASRAELVHAAGHSVKESAARLLNVLKSALVAFFGFLLDLGRVAGRDVVRDGLGTQVSDYSFPYEVGEHERWDV